MWEDPNEAGDIESLNSDGSPVYGGRGICTIAVPAFLLPSQGVNPVLPEEMVKAVPGAVAVKTTLILLSTQSHHPSLLLDL